MFKGLHTFQLYLETIANESSFHFEEKQKVEDTIQPLHFPSANIEIGNASNDKQVLPVTYRA